MKKIILTIITLITFIMSFTTISFANGPDVKISKDDIEKIYNDFIIDKTDKLNYLLKNHVEIDCRVISQNITWSFIYDLIEKNIYVHLLTFKSEKDYITLHSAIFYKLEDGKWYVADPALQLYLMPQKGFEQINLVNIPLKDYRDYIENLNLPILQSSKINYHYPFQN